MAGVDVEQPLVGNGDPLRVAADVFQDMLGPGEGRFENPIRAGLTQTLVEYPFAGSELYDHRLV